MSKIIGISGRMGSGKDEIAEVIKSVDPEFEVKKYAGKLKEMASLLTGIPVEKFEDQDFKSSNLGSEWDINGNQMTVRKLLQDLGTEAIRNNIHQDAWCNSLFSDIKDDSKWIITDVRFPNEVEYIKSRGGIVVRVNRYRSQDAWLKHIGFEPKKFFQLAGFFRYSQSKLFSHNEESITIEDALNIFSWDVKTLRGYEKTMNLDAIEYVKELVLPHLHDSEKSLPAISDDYDYIFKNDSTLEDFHSDIHKFIETFIKTK